VHTEIWTLANHLATGHIRPVYSAHGDLDPSHIRHRNFIASLNGIVPSNSKFRGIDFLLIIWHVLTVNKFQVVLELAGVLPCDIWFAHCSDYDKYYHLRHDVFLWGSLTPNMETTGFSETTLYFYKIRHQHMSYGYTSIFQSLAYSQKSSLNSILCPLN
jgi:hypothetical protein